MIFTTRDGFGTMTRNSSAKLDVESDVFISRHGTADRVELSLYTNCGATVMRFTSAQARAVAAELLACANVNKANEGNEV